MNKGEIINLINSGRELEFIYNNRNYSITYGILEGNEVISFCEFNKESTEVETVDELLNIKRYDVSVEEMLLSLSDKDIWIF